MIREQSKKELLEVIRPRYQNAKRKEEQGTLDELVAATGYHRKYAIRGLGQAARKKHIRKRDRRKIYQGGIVVVLEQIWEICGRI